MAVVARARDTAPVSEPTDNDVSLPWFAATRPERPLLTHERIVGAAHELVHVGGVDALSVRALARSLDVGASQLHRRIERKEHLLVAVADLVLSEIQVPSEARDQTAETWRERLRSFAFDIRRVLADHPHVHPVLDSYVLVTPAAVRVAEHAVSILLGAGYEGDTLVDAYNAWAGYVFGFSVVEMQPEQRRSDRLQLERWVRTYLGGLDRHRHPGLHAALPALENRAFGLRWEAGPLGVGGSSFGVGLDALLAGLPSPRPEPSSRVS